MTPQRVADGAHVHLSTAYRWKRGKEPDAKQLAALRAAGLLTTADLRAGGVEVIR